MNLLHTPEYTENAKDSAGNERLCGNDACKDYRGERTKLSHYNKEDYCGSCQRDPEVDTSRPAIRRHGTGVYDLKNLRSVARRRKMKYAQISARCASLEKEISTNTLSQWGRGKSLAPEDDTATLTRVLDCTLEELTGD